MESLTIELVLFMGILIAFALFLMVYGMIKKGAIFNMFSAMVWFALVILLAEINTILMLVFVALFVINIIIAINILKGE